MKTFSLVVLLALVSFFVGVGVTYVATSTAWVSDMANQPTIKPQEMPFEAPRGAVPVGPIEMRLAAHQSQAAPNQPEQEPAGTPGGHHGGAAPSGSDHHGGASTMPMKQPGGGTAGGQGHHGGAAPTDPDHHGGASPMPMGKPGSGSGGGQGHHGGVAPAGPDHHGGAMPMPKGQPGGMSHGGQGHHGDAAPTGPDHHGGATPVPKGQGDSTTPGGQGHHGGTTPEPQDHHGGTAPAGPDHHGGASPGPQGQHGSHGDAHGMAMGHGSGMANPVESTAASVKEGESLFGVYCSVCHGARGQGNMPIAAKYPKIPKFSRDLLRQTPDSHMFSMLTSGHGPMPGYAEALSGPERWAVINYLRSIQDKM